MHKHVNVNTRGRDFVVGDIHGCYYLVEKFMEHVNFDRSKDRLFGCGDLVDRGPESVKCLNLLYEHWYDQVAGNHEEMTVDYFTNQGNFDIYLGNGGLWAQEHKTADNDESVFVQGAVLDVMQNLPWMITVPMINGKFFHIVHAEIFEDQPLTDDDLDDPLWLHRIKQIYTADGCALKWGRWLFHPVYMQIMDSRNIEKYRRWYAMNKCGTMFTPELSHIYCGHSIVKQPTRVAGQTNLDTGAFLSARASMYSGRVLDPWAGLTFTEPLTDRFWTVKSHEIVETQPLVLI